MLTVRTLNLNHLCTICEFILRFNFICYLVKINFNNVTGGADLDPCLARVVINDVIRVFKTLLVTKFLEEKNVYEIFQENQKFCTLVRFIIFVIFEMKTLR
jgi:hypothetical protein